jgi:hypothetical protein
MEHKQTVLPLPQFLAKYRTNKETVCIDEEIVDTMKVLWEHGIETLGCCQEAEGSMPTIIVASHYDMAKINEIDAILRKCDERKFVILQWKNAIVDGAPIEKLCMVGCNQPKNTWRSVGCQVCNTGMCFFDGPCPVIKFVS